MPDRRWFVQKTNPEFIDYLSKASSVSPAFAQILINRGIKTPSEVRAFLNPSIEDMEDPAALQGVREAAEMIKAAISSGKKILIHGDYDTDGLTGTAILVSALRSMGASVDYFIPERLSHGYGFNPPGVEYAARTGTDLIITVDCGITSFEAVTLAKQAGIRTIITDHHEPKKDKTGQPLIPEADLVINPRITDPGSLISGSMVAFKLASELLGRERSIPLIDLATLGTIADIVPLIGENRVLVREGLRLINESPRTGILALREVSRLNGRDITAGRLAFTIIPRLNASGRVDKARDVISLLLAEEYEDAMARASHLDELNRKRQGIQEEIYQEALHLLNEKGYDLSIVLASEGWHEGIVGIVASRLAEEFYRPSFVFSIKEGIAKGSARSIPSFDLLSGISSCRNYLISFGGHRQAAGLRLRVEDLPVFERAINEHIGKTLTRTDLIPALTIDATVSLRDVNFSLVREIEQMEPFGCGNPSPLLGARKCEVLSARVVGNGHLKLRLGHKASAIDSIGFNMGDQLEIVEENRFIDAVFTPTINNWERGKTLQLKLHALRPSRID